jgi:hypothetical protein
MTLLALARYGSTLSPLLQKPDSVPDLLALVDDVPTALYALGHPHLAKLRLIPPVTVAYECGKLSLFTPEEATRRDDLYLAGRLSKKLEILHGDFDELIEAAVSTVVEISALGLPRRISLEEAVLDALFVSYRAEVRPEGPDKVRRLFAAFPDFYRRRFAPRIEAHARARGLAVHNDFLVDDRADAVRARERRRLQRLLTRSRRRSILRWPQQLLVFDGSVGYVLGKLRRSWL